MRGWFSIAAHRPFLEDLAAGLIAQYGTDPDGLAEAVILLPNRRGARDLAEAFLKAAEGPPAVLLPRILALGDLETGEPPFEPADIAVSLPPAVDPLRRRFELARLATAYAAAHDEPLDARGALDMADALAGFLDTLATRSEVRPDELDGLVPADQALHWAEAAGLLKRSLIEWPRRLEELGVMDASVRRGEILRRLTDQWEVRPPNHPVIAAGSNEADGPVARLLGVIAGAPQGCVVLPGLDEGLADSAWAEVGEAHPQGAIKALLSANRMDRGDVAPWPASAGAEGATRGRARRRVINESLRPAEATSDWLNVLDQLRKGQTFDPVREGLKGLAVVSAAHEEEAAAVCAVLMREALETPGKTCALVTPDQTLARRVEARLARWGLAVDDSAGAPLSRSRQGRLLGLVARLMADPLNPILILSLIKHPDVRAHPRGVRGLEDAALRGPAPRSWAEVQARILAARDRDSRGKIRPPWRLARLDAAEDLAERLATVLTEGASDGAADVLAADLVERIEALAGDRAWVGPEGEAAARLMAGLVEHGSALPELSAAAFADLIEALAHDQTVRVDRAAHPRLRILGAIEARLARADRMILAGLEEGVWPRAAPADPFLSRPMRQKLGLASPEQRLGLAAHDFAQAASAPEVYLIQSERRDSQPAVPSRWLWRLETLVKGAEIAEGLPTRPEVLVWARALDEAGTFRPASRPMPTPPLVSRPIYWPVTDIERLTRDPYVIWARKIAKLEVLSPPNEAVDARLRGSAIHAAFEDFSGLLNRGETADAATFERLYLDALRAGGMDESGLAREAALARQTAAEVISFEAERRQDGRRVEVEQRGEHPVQIGTRQHLISARADRVEIRDGGIHILDFKTGAPPKAKEVEAGFAPQLTLTGAIAARGGFGGQTLEPQGLTYVRVSGREPPIEVQEATKEIGPAEASQAAWDGVIELLIAYENDTQPYRSRLAPKFIKYASEYDHLARVFEWNSSDDGGGE
ncbi:MAG: double-strand break repair protein AddB [Caulobacterales bacterium]|nr:double-strand break repair protein AddB [Caulobacterales bacterium]